ncbi:MAG: hypothetical protein JRH20_26270 [Deltaproteobacteria bacterium]|nr:hypothetical protein [Deltaproteobacteria bacterium]
MPGPVPLFINAAIYLVFLVVWIAIQRADRQPYLRWWIAAYSTFTTYYLLAAIRRCGLLLSLAPIQDALLLLAAAFLVVGVYRFAERRPPRWFLLLIASSILLQLLTSVLPLSPSLARWALFITAAVLVGSVGWFVRRVPRSKFGRHFAMVGLLGLAAWSLLMPFMDRLPLLAKVEPHGDLLFILLISVGVVLMHLERAHKEQQKVTNIYTSLFARAPVCLFRMDASGHIVQFNPMFGTTLGLFSKEEPVLLDSLAHDEHTQRRITRWVEDQIDLCGEKLRFHGVEGPVRMVLELRWQEDDLGQAWADGMLQNMSAEIALRDRIERGQRVEALGRLGGGIAHDFNNILTVMISSLELASFKLNKGPNKDAAAKHLHRAIDGAERAAALTRKLLTLARQPPHTRRLLDLNVVVADELDLLGRTLGERVALRFESSPTPLCVQADRSELSQIIINLVFNAQDAMPKGGVVALSVAAAMLEGEPAARLRVSDTGHGMDAQTVDRVFDPFFTTRTPGKGIGLGLSTVHGIVRSLGGEITLSSTLGERTEFEVLLPRASAQSDDPATPMESIAS